ncbi:DUF6106 family protein [Clostridium thermarum]|uniref:DUF6106 family protein n=1 Tax=Clostridium thermarum TaxID=1716543 RepID=UPI0011235E41|nr:DUF6106 family protein [Clostridium thermarum]
MDSFYEQLVTTQKTAAYSFANGATYVFGVLGFLFVGGGMNLPLAVIAIGTAVGLFFLKKKLYREYEYDFTNGDIDIDVIYEMKSRKRLVSFSAKEIELLAPLDSDPVKDFSNKPEKVLKLYPSTSKERVYAAMVTGGTNRMQIHFVPNEKFIDLCYRYNPKAVKKFL